VLNQGSKTALKRVLASLLGMVQTRLELAGLELAHAGKQALKTLVWALAMVLALALASLLLCCVVVLLAWDTCRLQALLGCLGLYLVLAFWAYRKLRTCVRAQRPLLEAMVAELGRDREAILDSIAEPLAPKHATEDHTRE
jgi:uncharacterized membrane protein YqjE